MTALPPLLPDAAQPREPLVPGWAWLRRRRDITVPLAVPLAFAFAGEALNLTAHSGPAALASTTAATAVGASVLGAAVWWAAPHKWDRTSEQWYARLSAILAGSWLTYTAHAGLDLVSAIGLAVGSLAWGIPWWWHKRTRKNAHAKLVASWAEWWAHYARHWDLEGSGVIDVSTEGVIDTLHVQLARGKQTIKHVTGALPLIESALAGHVEHGMTRAEKAKGRPDQVLVHLKRENPLDVDVTWDPSLAPESVSQQMPIGKNEGGNWERSPMRTNWFLNGAERTGKALALDTLIPTPSGWATMGDIQPGDQVFDELGHPCQVVAATDVMHGHKCYRVTFSDGSQIVADAEHSWLVETSASRNADGRSGRPRGYIRGSGTRASSWPQILTTEAMSRSVKTPVGNNYSVPVAAALQCPEALLLVPPYTLGAWLGDGGTLTGSVTTADSEIITAIESEGEITWRVPSTVKPHHASYRVEWLTSRLHSIGVLGSKHIPGEYLRASEAQRRALLAGLLDTDGHCTRQGGVEYTSTSERLARDVHHLAATLGYKPTLRAKTARLYGKDCGTVWTVAFTAPDKVFGLQRKTARQVAKASPVNGRRFITSIEPAPSVPVRCIAVGSPAHLYLAGNMCIPTHNSNELSAFEASETGCIDAAWPWIIDLKGGRSARPWTHPGGDGWIAITIEEARLLLAVAVLELRARALHAYTGDEQLEPTPEIPLVRIVIDEANTVTSTSAGDFECRRDAGIVASQGGAVNFRMTVLTQYGALDESVGTEQIRSNLKSRCCFQVTQPAHGQFTLTDWANLDPSRLDNQGEFYWQAGPKVPSSPCRGPRMDHDLVRRIAARNATLPRPPLLFYSADQLVPGTDGLTVQEVWDTRWERCPEQFRPGYAAPQRGLSPPPPPPPRTSRTETPMQPQDTAPDSPYAIAARIEDEVASLPEGDPPLLDPGVLASQIDHAKHTFARLLTDAPPAGVSPTQLINGSGMSKSWVHQMLGDLIKAGAIAQPGRGRYLPAPGRDVWAAIMEITEARAAMYVQAKQLVGAGGPQ